MRNGSRAWDWEALEARLALSTAPGFGAIGDSLADEYRFYPPDRSQARNWVETLAATRSVNFGTYTTQDRGLPRDQGYAYDWAKSGETSSQIVGSQLAGLASQVASGKVTYATVAMGTDDFLQLAEGLAEDAVLGHFPADFSSELAAVEANAVSNFDASVATLLAASPNARVIVQTSPSLLDVPIIADSLAIPQVAPVVGAIAAAQEEYNTQIRDVAEAIPRVGLADVDAQFAAIGAGSKATYPIGSVQLSLLTAGDGYQDAVLADQVHPGTIAQGLIANAEIAAADDLGASIKLLTPGEIVTRAKDVAAHPGTVR